MKTFYIAVLSKVCNRDCRDGGRDKKNQSHSTPLVRTHVNCTAVFLSTNVSYFCHYILVSFAYIHRLLIF